MELRGARVLVVGLERSGLAAIQLLAAKGALVRVTDLRPLEELPEARGRLAGLGAGFEPQSPETFKKPVDLIVLSPGVPADLEPVAAARLRGVPVIGEVELAFWYLEGGIIGITGSNGKTTTTALTGHILRESGLAAQVGGNIGAPATGMVASSRAGQWNVLELSSFQLETIQTFRANLAVVLNVTPDHLDRHHTFADYVAAKGRIFENQQAGDFAVLNADDAACVAFAGQAKSAPVWFSSTRPVTPGLWLSEGKVWFDDELLIEAREIPMRGRHNVENVMAAAAAARLAGAPINGMAAAIRSFAGVEHRLEFVRSVGGVEFYNDSKATNVDATLKAVDAFGGGLWVILGGKDKGSDYTPLREPLRAKARAALLIGAAAPLIARQLDSAVPVIEAGTIESAVLRAHRSARPGETVLLAPACASFDQFRNFEHRGEVFKQIVSRLNVESGSLEDRDGAAVEN
ncbi:MAG: UDP-N-acetylmuramoyl-L-alanine--D-glutamate ligase [Acidobacteria bacterium]|nr:UDP-N-acetylmuramoyl-L-alanine--D-glutamate ligase [Acidobacteriota bacterium]